MTESVHGLCPRCMHLFLIPNCNRMIQGGQNDLPPRPKPVTNLYYLEFHRLRRRLRRLRRRRPRRWTSSPPASKPHQSLVRHKSTPLMKLNSCKKLTKKMFAASRHQNKFDPTIASRLPMFERGRRIRSACCRKGRRISRRGSDLSPPLSSRLTSTQRRRKRNKSAVSSLRRRCRKPM